MRRRIAWVAGAMGLAAAVCTARLAWEAWTSRPPAPGSSLRFARVTYHTRTERVMTIGGSVAHGWKDSEHLGFLRRAFIELTNHTPTAYQYIDRTIIGANGTQLDTMYKGKYETWLNTDKPQIVVIAWGLLNDARPKTPMDQFLLHLRNEVNEALAHHAVVFIVTPPVTRASYTQYPTAQQAYVDAEVKFVQDLNDPNVYVFDVFDQMKDYLTRTHQTYEPYMGDGWHPNTAGHVLAGRILYQNLIQTFGTQPIVFQTPQTGGQAPGTPGGTPAGATGGNTAGTQGGTGAGTPCTPAPAGTPAPSAPAAGGTTPAGVPGARAAGQGGSPSRRVMP
ncbi:SGNH/GDSL hydrolase family protein [Alicyclobacillus cellulosilyticus]|uniref:SGNH/GDSL hydrolase family protein n=1 Tax=Alicyclobacillus cellulosilyticus TaxID=1003997 RepID=UPI001668F745|nr:SGNH/GDSL hydrolase family protein [Alicyclobacillus cellulosilyticus]